ncbi:MAG TPA: hypothetical protein VK659_18870 [Asanoa sp.]|nr:hypothetical protein [Asanoa sp.]
MIPTLILFGLVCGRWWRSALVAAAVGWPVLLLATGTLDLRPLPLLAAAGLAVVNAAVGVAGHQAVRKLILDSVHRA